MYFLNNFTKNKIEAQSEEIAIAEGITISNLVEVSGKYLTENGVNSLEAFLKNIYKNELIVYIGLFQENELIFLLSRFEGYFPAVDDQKDMHIIDSPIGKIFDIKSNFKNKNKKSFRLHIGFNYNFLTTFETTLTRNFFVVAVFIIIIMLLIIGLIIYFDGKFFQKELEIKLEKEDKEHFKDLSLLTSEIAHEIKNPLNSIYLSFSALEKYLVKEDENAVFYKDAIKNEIKRISEIINSYSSVSKKVRTNFQKIEMDGFLNEFFLLKEKELNESGIEMIIKNSIKFFVSDRELLTQILLNLINNAIEAKADRIEIELEEKEGNLELIIRDNGDEINEDIRGKIFKPYISSKTKGMGLGLHITLKLLKALNGTIQLVSRDKGNKVFKIKIRKN